MVFFDMHEILKQNARSLETNEVSLATFSKEGGFCSD